MEQDIIITPEIEEQNIEVIAEQGVFPKGVININTNGETDVTNYATANVDVDFNLQDKEVSITQNGNTTIEADTSYDGLKKVELNVNVPAQKYKPKIISFSQFNGNDLLYETQNLDTTELTTFANIFYYNQNLTYIDTSGWQASTPTDYSNTFYYCFRYTGGRLIDLDLSGIRSDSKLNMSSTFYNCNYLRKIDLSNVTKVQKMDATFRNCQRLEILDISNMDISQVDTSQSYNYQLVFAGCGTSTASGLTTVYVKDQASQDWILNLPTNHRPATWSTANVIIKS